jgi:hypothetical protein
MHAPVIVSVGPPPELHANRVVAEMLRLIARALPQLHDKISQILTAMPDGNPTAQEKIRRKLEETGGLFFTNVLLKPGKRGRYVLHIVSINSWNPERKEYIQYQGDGVPDRPWLLCTINKIESTGHHRYEQSESKLLFVTHHALSRLAQRYQAKNSGDLLVAVQNILDAFMRRMVEKKQSGKDRHHWFNDGYRLRFELNENVTAAAVIKRCDDEEIKCPVVVTIV